MRYEIDLKLYVPEFLGMYGFFTKIEQASSELFAVQELGSMNATDLLLAEYATKLIYGPKLYVWNNKKRRKLYNMKLPASVAMALHKEMQQQPLSHDQQDFLSKIDERLKSRGFLRNEVIHVDGKAGWE